MDLSYSSTVIDDKTIYHAKIEAELYDTFFLMSDGVKYAGVGETLNTYKKMFEKKYDEPLDVMVHAEISFDNVNIENFFEEYNSPYYSSELDDAISRIIFVINSRKHIFYTVFPEDTWE